LAFAGIYVRVRCPENKHSKEIIDELGVIDYSLVSPKRGTWDGDLRNMEYGHSDRLSSSNSALEYENKECE
jgi:hypothetical protein